MLLDIKSSKVLQYTIVSSQLKIHVTHLSIAIQYYCCIGGWIILIAYM